MEVEIRPAFPSGPTYQNFEVDRINVNGHTTNESEINNDEPTPKSIRENGFEEKQTESEEETKIVVDELVAENDTEKIQEEWSDDDKPLISLVKNEGGENEIIVECAEISEKPIEVEEEEEKEEEVIKEEEPSECATETAPSQINSDTESLDENEKSQPSEPEKVQPKAEIPPPGSYSYVPPQFARRSIRDSPGPQPSSYQNPTPGGSGMKRKAPLEDSSSEAPAEKRQCQGWIEWVNPLRWIRKPEISADEVVVEPERNSCRIM